MNKEQSKTYVNPRTQAEMVAFQVQRVAMNIVARCPQVNVEFQSDETNDRTIIKATSPKGYVKNAYSNLFLAQMNNEAIETVADDFVKMLFSLPMQSDASDMERECLKKLSEAWACFLKLPPAHPDDEHEFKSGIHQCQ
ncbi:MAG: hypothetical protein KGJ13_11490, partial [Patescibacteria group bacterium]|nr:hypothetical protein [Patescibacteria group bacterium]